MLPSESFTVPQYLSEQALFRETLSQLNSAKSLSVNPQGNLIPTGLFKDFFKMGTVNNPRFVELKIMEFLIKGKKWLKPEDIKLIEQLARKAGLVLEKKNSIIRHQELRLLISLISKEILQKETVSPDDYTNLCKAFQTHYRSPLAPYSKQCEQIMSFVSLLLLKNENKEETNNETVGDETPSNSGSNDAEQQEESETKRSLLRKKDSLIESNDNSISLEKNRLDAISSFPIPESKLTKSEDFTENPPNHLPKIKERPSKVAPARRRTRRVVNSYGENKKLAAKTALGAVAAVAMGSALYNSYKNWNPTIVIQPISAILPDNLISYPGMVTVGLGLLASVLGVGYYARKGNDDQSDGQSPVKNTLNNGSSSNIVYETRTVTTGNDQQQVGDVHNNDINHVDRSILLKNLDLVPFFEILNSNDLKNSEDFIDKFDIKTDFPEDLWSFSENFPTTDLPYQNLEGEYSDHSYRISEYGWVIFKKDLHTTINTMENLSKLNVMINHPTLFELWERITNALKEISREAEKLSGKNILSEEEFSSLKLATKAERRETTLTTQLGIELKKIERASLLEFLGHLAAITLKPEDIDSSKSSSSSLIPCISEFFGALNIYYYGTERSQKITAGLEKLRDYINERSPRQQRDMSNGKMGVANFIYEQCFKTLFSVESIPDAEDYIRTMTEKNSVNEEMVNIARTRNVGGTHFVCDVLAKQGFWTLDSIGSRKTNIPDSHFNSLLSDEEIYERNLNEKQFVEENIEEELNYSSVKDQNSLEVSESFYRSSQPLELENINVPIQKDNNCYLSAGWLKFCVFLHFFKQSMGYSSKVNDLTTGHQSPSDLDLTIPITETTDDVTITKKPKRKPHLGNVVNSSETSILENKSNEKEINLYKNLNILTEEILEFNENPLIDTKEKIREHVNSIKSIAFESSEFFKAKLSDEEAETLKSITKELVLGLQLCEARLKNVCKDESIGERIQPISLPSNNKQLITYPSQFSIDTVKIQKNDDLTREYGCTKNSKSHLDFFTYGKKVDAQIDHLRVYMNSLELLKLVTDDENDFMGLYKIADEEIRNLTKKPSILEAKEFLALINNFSNDELQILISMLKNSELLSIHDNFYEAKQKAFFDEKAGWLKVFNEYDWIGDAIEDRIDFLNPKNSDEFTDSYFHHPDETEGLANQLKNSYDLSSKNKTNIISKKSEGKKINSELKIDCTRLNKRDFNSLFDIIDTTDEEKAFDFILNFEPDTDFPKELWDFSENYPTNPLPFRDFEKGEHFDLKAVKLFKKRLDTSLESLGELSKKPPISEHQSLVTLCEKLKAKLIDIRTKWEKLFDLVKNNKNTGELSQEFITSLKMETKITNQLKIELIKIERENLLRFLGNLAFLTLKKCEDSDYLTLGLEKLRQYITLRSSRRKKDMGEKQQGFDAFVYKFCLDTLFPTSTDKEKFTSKMNEITNVDEKEIIIASTRNPNNGAHYVCDVLSDQGIVMLNSIEPQKTLRLSFLRDIDSLTVSESFYKTCTPLILKNVTVPTQNDNNCYLSAGWLKFCVFLHFFKQSMS